MPKPVMKDIHFQVPLGLFESFYRAFPERGERKIILTEFVKEAISLQSHKTYFTKMVARNVGNSYYRDEIDGLGEEKGG